MNYNNLKYNNLSANDTDAFLKTAIQVGRPLPSNFHPPSVFNPPAAGIDFFMACCFNRFAWRHNRSDNYPENLFKPNLKEQLTESEFNLAFKRVGNTYIPTSSTPSSFGKLLGTLTNGSHTTCHRGLSTGYYIPDLIRNYLKTYHTEGE